MPVRPIDSAFDEHGQTESLMSVDEARPVARAAGLVLLRTVIASADRSLAKEARLISWTIAGSFSPLRAG